MKAVFVVVVFALGAMSFRIAAAQQAVYPPPRVIVYSAPVYSSYQLPAPTFSAPVQQAYSVPAYVQPTYPAPAYVPAEPNFFERLMEMERRKNAWLRQTFLGMP